MTVRRTKLLNLSVKCNKFERDLVCKEQEINQNEGTLGTKRQNELTKKYLRKVLDAQQIIASLRKKSKIKIGIC